MGLKVFATGAAALSILAAGSPAQAVDNRMGFAGGARTEILQEPAIETAAEAELGRSMVTFSKQIATPAIRTRTPVTTREVGIELTIPAGVLVLHGENPEGKFYQYPGFVQLRSIGVDLPTASGGLYVPNDPDKPMYTFRYMLMGPKLKEAPRIPFEPTVYLEKGGVSFRVEFIYTGMTNHVLTATYREFRDDMARPAFTQELKYDISQDKMIGFKGARIEVLSAGNISIKYVVHKGFDEMVF